MRKTLSEKVPIIFAYTFWNIVVSTVDMNNISNK